MGDESTDGETDVDSLAEETLTLPEQLESSDVAGPQSLEVEPFLAAIVASSADAIIGKTLSGEIVSWNAAAERLYGYSATDMLGRDIAMLFPRDRTDELPQILNRIRNGETVQDLLTARVKKDGTLIAVSVTVSPVHASDGRVVGAATTARDMTAYFETAKELDRAHRSTAEALSILEILQDTASVGFGFIDPELRIVRLNEMLAAINGSSVQDQIGRKVAEVVPQIWPQLEPVYRRVLETGESVVNIEVSGELRAEPGNVRHWLASYYPVATDGQIIGIGVVVFDISELKRADTDLRALEGRLRQSERLESLTDPVMPHMSETTGRPVTTTANTLETPRPVAARLVRPRSTMLTGTLVVIGAFVASLFLVLVLGALRGNAFAATPASASAPVSTGSGGETDAPATPPPAATASSGTTPRWSAAPAVAIAPDPVVTPPADVAAPPASAPSAVAAAESYSHAWAVAPTASALAALPASSLPDPGASRTAIPAIVAPLVSPPAINQCNGTDNAGGQAVACSVGVINNLDLATGVTSSTLTVTECHGAAHAPPTCTTTTTTSTQLITSVTQCDGSGSGGGGTVTCSVAIVNNITGVVTPTPATVNQCNVSGQGGGTAPTILCNPLGNTTGATVTQCNSSGNGGGGTMRVQCSVLPSTQTSALPVTVDQCNGSGNGGGATVTCTVSLTNNIVTAPVVPPVVTPPVPTPPVPTPPVPTPPVVSPISGTPTPVSPPGSTPPGTGPTGIGPASATPPGATPAPGSAASGTGAAGTSLIPGAPTASILPGTSNLSGTLPASPPAAGGTLAFTGSDTAMMVLVALIAVMFGALLILLAGRRPRRSVSGE